MPLIYDGITHPVEIGAGRGDLRYTSVPLYTGGQNRRTNLLVGDRQISFAQLFATQPWVAAAVMRMLTWAVRVPLKAYRRTGEDSRVRLYPGDHPVAGGINDPWERGSQADLVMSLLGPLLVHGQSITEVDQGARGVLRFMPADWRYAQPIIPFRDRVSGWKLDSDDPTMERVVPVDSVVHAKWWSALGPLGTSPLQMLGVTLALEDAAQRYQRSMFERGARPPSAITASEQFLGLDDVERQALLQQLRDDVTALYVGPENAGRPVLLPPGLDWKPVGHTAVEAALIDQRKVAREEVCAVYQIPPPMLGILDRATFNNIEIQRQMAYTDALGPPLVLLEQQLNAQVVRGLLREEDVYVEFDFNGVLRGDRLKEIEALREAISVGLLTPNEGRAIDNRQRSTEPLADVLWMPWNNLRPMRDPPPDKPGGSTQSDPPPPGGN